MTFLLAAALYVAAGLALLGLLRLGTGSRAADVPLAWLVGTGWFAAVAPVVRFAAGIPLGRATALAIVLAPAVAWGALRWRARRASAAATPSPPEEESPLPSPASRGEGSPGTQEGERGAAARWLPRPVWLFAPMAAYVILVTAMVVLHGTNTPTQTDDGIRVRAFASILAFADAWAPDARGIFSMAGPLPTFVPALGTILSGTLDHFHANYAILADLVALVALAVTLGSARASPERGWAGALGVLSIPLFVYHCTSTYSDAVLAIRVGAGVLFVVEHARTRERADAARALLLLGLAALVKREGELVAVAPAAVLVAELVWERRREGRAFPWPSLALFAVPLALDAIGKIAAVGLAGAFPMAGFVAQQAGIAAAASPVSRTAALTRAAAQQFFGPALFRTGNQGMVYWVAVAAIAVRARALVRTPAVWPLLAVLALFAEVAVSSVLLVPEFTVNQGTVHRALLVVSVPLALWVAATIADAARAEAAGAARDREEKEAEREAATPPPRRRSRRGPRR